MDQIELGETKDRLAELVERVRGGEAVVIVQDGRPVAQLAAPPDEAAKRRPGSAKGLGRVHENFDDPMPKDFMRYFE